jgi:hypothetical protein
MAGTIPDDGDRLATMLDNYRYYRAGIDLFGTPSVRRATDEFALLMRSGRTIRDQVVDFGLPPQPVVGVVGVVTEVVVPLAQHDGEDQRELDGELPGHSGFIESLNGRVRGHAGQEVARNVFAARVEADESPRVASGFGHSERGCGPAQRGHLNVTTTGAGSRFAAARIDGGVDRLRQLTDDMARKATPGGVPISPGS